jgi:glutamate N-acetyltransferase / amino-acid N-acetyltransferase
MTPVPVEVGKSTRSAVEKDKQFLVPGFLFSTGASSQKVIDVQDIALIYSPTEARAAGLFTRNRVQAAPVLVTSRRIASGKAHAVLVNSGCANACTGKQGLDDALRSTKLVADRLKINPDQVMVASTGVIGRPLNMKGIEQALPGLVDNLNEYGLPAVARSIMTTDTVPKISQAQGSIGGHAFSVCGIGKGAGMMRPDVATMLVFMMTDLDIDAQSLRQVLRAATEPTFNRINVDGDTSTNDTVLALANGRAGNEPVTAATGPHLKEAERVFYAVANDLSRMMIMDAEGATKFIEIEVKGALNNEHAAKAAHTVAESKLVKTAFFGEDANWGRIMAALGRCGAELNPEKVDIYVDNIPLVSQGCGSERGESEAGVRLKNREFRVTIDLNLGSGEAMVYTTDLSLDYVRINAHYRT